MRSIWMAVAVMTVLTVSSCGKAPRPEEADGRESGISDEKAPASHPLAQYLGQACTVQFKRNALGGGANLPVPPTTGSINGAQVCLGGTLEAVTGNSILIAQPQKRYWIPIDSVLLVEFHGQP